MPLFHVILVPGFPFRLFLRKCTSFPEPSETTVNNLHLDKCLPGVQRAEHVWGWATHYSHLLAAQLHLEVEGKSTSPPLHMLKTGQVTFEYLEDLFFCQVEMARIVILNPGQKAAWLLVLLLRQNYLRWNAFCFIFPLFGMHALSSVAVVFLQCAVCLQILHYCKQKYPVSFLWVRVTSDFVWLPRSPKDSWLIRELK